MDASSRIKCNKTTNVLLWTIAIFSIIGMVIAGYSTLEHFGGASAEFCSVNETFDCDIVNGSAYSKVIGIPVAVLGFISYTLLFVGTLLYACKRQEVVLTLLGALALVSLAFSLYLTYVEAYVLYTWCLLCLGSQFVILIITIALLWVNTLNKKRRSLKEIHQ